MKRFIFLLLVLPAGHAFAQHELLPLEPFSKNPLQILKKPLVIAADTLSPYRQGLLKRLTENNWLAQGRKSHTTSQGTVYVMPFDNMPCLVPDIKKSAPMPTMKSVPGGRMPNGFKGIPRAKR